MVFTQETRANGFGESCRAHHRAVPITCDYPHSLRGMLEASTEKRVVMLKPGRTNAHPQLASTRIGREQHTMRLNGRGTERGWTTKTGPTRVPSRRMGEGMVGESRDEHKTKKGHRRSANEPVRNVPALSSWNDRCRTVRREW